MANSPRYQPPMNMADRDPALQWRWHEAYRDMSKNQFRTSYTDMTHFREVNVRTDYPAGYGGHIPSMRFDVLFRNTEFDRKQVLMRSDPSRDAKPTFADQLLGVPTITKLPCGAPKNPTKGVCLHDGTTRPLAPWGITENPVAERLNQRSVPATIRRMRSMPGLARSNSAAMGAGSHMMGAGEAPASSASPHHQQQMHMGRSGGMQAAPADYYPEPQQHMPDMQMQMPPQQGGESPNAARLRHTVEMANEEARHGMMPTEAQILHEQMNR
eukprot:TRINITY_DN1285_c1_g1_i1.p1 TRINITY_DN1285_c1_g1~~TRINITY_DN1285_c1_g1_i1.p1  ORF type:complete len:270 (+),score=63.69 TRINITY_DN1285_c1_g1_i1:114-923(+)